MLFIIKKKKRRSTVTTILWLFLVMTLTGCKESMYSNLTEAEANQMLALLLNHQIDAEKQSVNGKSITLKVETSQYATAVELLRQNGFPRQSFATVEQLFPQDGLVATPTQEKARFEYALSQALAETLNQIDGVMTARVHLVIPEEKRVSKPSPSSAAVFVKHSQGTHISQLVPQIKSLMQSSIEGLAYDDVKVVLVESSMPPPVLSISPEAQNNQGTYLYITITVLFLLLIGVSVYFFLALKKQKCIHQELLENVTQS